MVCHSLRWTFKKRDRKSSSDSESTKPPAKACRMSDKTKVVNMSGQAAHTVNKPLCVADSIVGIQQVLNGVSLA